MTTERAQAILNEAERLHAEGWKVDQGTVGKIDHIGVSVMLWPETWLAMRAILIGRGFAVEARR